MGDPRTVIYQQLGKYRAGDPRSTLEAEFRFVDYEEETTGQQGQRPEQRPGQQGPRQRPEQRQREPRRISRPYSKEIWQRLKSNFPPSLPEVTVDLIQSVDRVSLRQTHSLTAATLLKKERLSDVDFPDLGYRFSISRETTLTSITDFRPSYLRKKTRFSFDFNFEEPTNQQGIPVEQLPTTTPVVARLDLTQTWGMILAKDVTLDDLPNLSGLDNMAILDMMLFQYGQQTLEIELEISDFGNIDGALFAVSFVNRIIFATEILYPISMKRKIFRNVNRLLKQGTTAELRVSSLVQPRNLTMNDLVWGGLMGNGETAYSVSHKADGHRRLLYIAANGIWLLGTPDVATYVSRQVIQGCLNCLLDGELIPLENRNVLPEDPRATVLYWYQVFDCLYFEAEVGSSEVLALSHGERMVRAQTVVDELRARSELSPGEPGFLDPALLLVETKSTYELDIVTETNSRRANSSIPVEQRMAHFFLVMERMLSEVDLQPFLTDGFIFTPTLSSYHTGAANRPLSKRVLTRYPDQCKWKTHMSIDLAVQLNTETKEYTLYAGGKSTTNQLGLLEFQGSDRYPFDSSMLDTRSELLVDIPQLSIVEFVWVTAQYNDLGEEEPIEPRLVPYRVRDNKNRPNLMEVAVANWDWAHEPIGQDILSGKSFALVFRYHNRIKKDLLSSMLKGDRSLNSPAKASTSKASTSKALTAKALTAKGKGRGKQPTNLGKSSQTISSKKVSRELYLLDIGSGKGGDVAKWKGYSKVLAIEPNSEYIPELRRRIDQSPMRGKIEVLEIGGEDTDRIYQAMIRWFGRKADVISLMLSMTFFWASKSLVRSLANTIDTCLLNNGTVLFLTFDGDLVQQIFRPAFRGLVVDALTFNPDLPVAYTEESIVKDNTLGLSAATIKYVESPEGSTSSAVQGSSSSTKGSSAKGSVSKDVKTIPHIEIDIPGSRTVSQQIEWLVHIYDLVLELGVDFSVKELHRAETEKFLSVDQAVFTRMYSFGAFTRSGVTGTRRLQSPEVAVRTLPLIDLPFGPPLPKNSGRVPPLAVVPPGKEITESSQPMKRTNVRPTMVNPTMVGNPTVVNRPVVGNPALAGCQRGRPRLASRSGHGVRTCRRRPRSAGQGRSKRRRQTAGLGCQTQ